MRNLAIALSLLSLQPTIGKTLPSLVYAATRHKPDPTPRAPQGARHQTGPAAELPRPANRGRHPTIVHSSPHHQQGGRSSLGPFRSADCQPFPPLGVPRRPARRAARDRNGAPAARFRADSRLLPEDAVSATRIAPIRWPETSRGRSAYASVLASTAAKVVGLESGDLRSAGVAADNLVMAVYVLVLFALRLVARLRASYSPSARTRTHSPLPRSRTQPLTRRLGGWPRPCPRLGAGTPL